MNNLFFFTGDNDYELTKEVVRWRKAFIAKYGEENYLLLKGRDSELKELLDAVGTMPFIAEKRLVLIEGVPRIDRDEFGKFCENIHPQTIVAVVDSKPDKRLSITKELEKKAQTKNFKSMIFSELIEWIKKETASMGSSISEKAAKNLISIVGEDQWILETEIKKVALHSSGGEITLTEIELLAVPSGTQVVWRLTDLIGNRNPMDALAFFRRRLERGEDPYGVWTVLLNLVKNLTLVVSAIDAGIKTDRAIAEATGVPFFAVRGMMPLARSMTISRVRELVEWAAEADYELKSGGYHYSAERPEEVIALSERIILSCT